MDSGDPTALLLTKLRSFEPDYASKIYGYLLLQDFGENELMELALGSESVLKSVILKVKRQLEISSNTLSSPSTPLSPSTLNPICRPFINSRGSFHSNGFMDFGRSSPLSPSSISPWSLNPNNGNNSHISPRHTPLKGTISDPLSSHKNNGVSATNVGSNDADLLDEQQLNDYLSFLDDSCSKTEDFADPRMPFDYSVRTHLHRRSFSADASFWPGGDDGFGVRCDPCVYFSRGSCKNGDTCKFVHSRYPDNVYGNGIVADSPRKVEQLVRQHEDMMRMRMAYQQKLAPQVFGRAPQLAYEKRMDFLLHQRAHRDGALPFGEERYWSSSPGRLERMEQMAMHFADTSNSASRQIYLTFPADSTFKDEDVATYFSNYGTVQDVRIPYQQDRMFGFVSFAHPETVKDVLARGNPHFICDSRVLVKPYKEKGKVLDKHDNRNQQFLLQPQIERGHYSPCSSPSGIDPRELSDFHLGSKMFYERQEMMMRRKMEQADLQRAIELERRRFINLQLPELKNNAVMNHHRSFSVGSPGYFSPVRNQVPDFQSAVTNADALEVVNNTSDLHPYPGSTNTIYSNGAKEATHESETLEPDTGSTVKLVLPTDIFPSETSTEDSAETGVSPTNEPPATSTSNLIQ